MGGEPSKPRAREQRPLKGAEKRLLALLGLPTFGLALAIGTTTTYVPMLARQFTSSTAVIGLVIAAEGLVALVVPASPVIWVLLAGAVAWAVWATATRGRSSPSAGMRAVSSSGGSGESSGGSSSGAVLVLAPGTPAPKPGSSAPAASGGSGGSGAKVANVFAVPASAHLILATPCQGKSGGSSQSSHSPAVPSGHGVLLTPRVGRSWAEPRPTCSTVSRG
jgi:hypothetical protein